MNFNLFDELPYRVYVRNSKQRIVYANKLVGDFFGCKLDELIGKKYDQIFKDEGFLQHLSQIDKTLFSGSMNSFTTVKEFNRYYKKESIFKVIDFICKCENERYIATILVEISDTYCATKGILLENIGYYDPANRLVKLNSGINICLTRLENSFLFMLNEKKGEILSYDEIFIGLDIYNSMNKTSLKSLVLRLKKKLGANIIKNISMSGYKLTKA